MQATSDLYKTILANPLHRKETKVVIGGTEYSGSNLVSVSVSGGLFDTPGVGGCASREVALTIFPIGTIPRQSSIEVYVRLVAGTQQSEWIPKGKFFISTRTLDKRTGTLDIVGYDAMLKAEEVWLNDDYIYDNWPMPQSEAVADIAYRIGVEVDSRTALSTQFPVEYPVDEDGDLTMREVLSYIAVSNAGNWIITDAGKLLLVGYGDLPTETNLLVTERGEAILFGEVRLLV